MSRWHRGHRDLSAAQRRIHTKQKLECRHRGSTVRSLIEPRQIRHEPAPPQSLDALLPIESVRRRCLPLSGWLDELMWWRSKREQTSNNESDSSTLSKCGAVGFRFLARESRTHHQATRTARQPTSRLSLPPQTLSDSASAYLFHHQRSRALILIHILTLKVEKI